MPFYPLTLVYTVTRDEFTARQCHLNRGVYPVWYPEPRGIPTAQWQIDVDNRIRYVPMVIQPTRELTEMVSRFLGTV